VLSTGWDRTPERGPDGHEKKRKARFFPLKEKNPFVGGQSSGGDPPSEFPQPGGKSIS